MNTRKWAMSVSLIIILVFGWIGSGLAQPKIINRDRVLDKATTSGSVKVLVQLAFPTLDDLLSILLRLPIFDSENLSLIERVTPKV
jgi:hypothetical protein